MDSAISGITTNAYVVLLYIRILVNRIFYRSNASFAFRMKCDKSFDGKHDLIAADHLRLISLFDTSCK